MSSAAADHVPDQKAPAAGKNEADVRCSKCNCLLLRSGHGFLVQLDVDLPKTDVSADAAAGEMERLTDFWMVDDIFTFENMGFSNTVENRKYLACAECELGPIGFHDLLSKHSYLSVARVAAPSHSS